MIWSNEEEIVPEAGSSGIVRCTAVDTVLCFLLFCGRHKIDDAACFCCWLFVLPRSFMVDNTSGYFWVDIEMR